MRAVQFYALFMHDEHWNLGTILARVENLEHKRAEWLELALPRQHLHVFPWETNTNRSSLFPMWSSTVEIDRSRTVEQLSACVVVDSVGQWKAQVSESRDT